jgi:RNA polymerase sigma-70 factor (ECF subfamily)
MTEFPETRSTLLVGLKSPEDREAWDDFVATYRPVIYRMARRRGLQDADAEDLAQDALIRVASAIERYESQSEVPFRHWLRRVATNAIVSALQRQPQDGGAGGTTAQDRLVHMPDDASALTAELATECQRELLLRAAAIVRQEVHPDTWQAFELTAIHGLSCEDAARSINKSVGTVYAARSRIIKRLQMQLKRMPTEEP